MKAKIAIILIGIYMMSLQAMDTNASIWSAIAAEIDQEDGIAKNELLPHVTGNNCTEQCSLGSIKTKIDEVKLSLPTDPDKVAEMRATLIKTIEKINELNKWAPTPSRILKKRRLQSQHKTRCEACKYQGKRPCNMAYHLRSDRHRNKMKEPLVTWHERLYACPPCKYGSDYSNNITTHIKTKHKSFPQTIIPPHT